MIIPKNSIWYLSVLPDLSDMLIAKKLIFVLIGTNLEKYPSNCAGDSKAIRVKFSSCLSQNYFLEKQMCVMKENSAHGKDQWQLLDTADLLCSQIAWQNRDENVSSNLSSLCVSVLELVGFKLRNWRNFGHFLFQFRRFYFQVMEKNDQFVFYWNLVWWLLYILRTRKFMKYNAKQQLLYFTRNR